MERTYVDHCLKEGLTVRWPDKMMPISVYIAPFYWHEKSKQQQSYTYHQMVIEAFHTWSEVSGGVVQFRHVGQLEESQIDIKWRRVDRKSLGHCEYLVNDKAMLYSAEIQIGISDGVIHKKYNDINEVKHTILHEIGHALGLVGHSDGPEDIMYVPHQYGVTSLSKRDIESIRTLYKLPVGFNYKAVGKQYNLPEPFEFHDVVDRVEGKTKSERPKEKTQKEKPKPNYKEQPERLKNQHDILSERGKFLIATQGFQYSTDLEKKYTENPKKKRPKKKQTD